MYNPQNPLIVQGDKSILLEVNNPLHDDARNMISRFAELIKSPEHIHSYRITNLSLWNAAASGMKSEDIITSLETYSKYDVPPNVKADIIDYVSRYGSLKLLKEDTQMILKSEDSILITELMNIKKLERFILRPIDQHTLEVRPELRGHIKQALTEIGFPVEDLAGYITGEFMPVDLLDITKNGIPFEVRDYQKNAINSFYADGDVRGGSGTIVLPCGAGKTIVGMGIMQKLKCNTLIITTNITAARQWADELIDKTTITKDTIGEYSGEIKEIKPVTIATYQILVYRKKNKDASGSEEIEFPHFTLFNSREWGLIIYDEVHLLPAPVFRITAELQATRRVGLTATLIREDGLEKNVFSLIGPKKYDAQWKELEKQAWIAEAKCTEIRIPMPDEHRMIYATAQHRSKYRIAAENPNKYDLTKKIVDYHTKRNDRILVVGMYLDQLKQLAEIFDAPILTGITSNKERKILYDKFRSGEIKLMVVSKVANFAIDLPEANVLVQVSGTFGSRQEEAQRLGRILRPKKDKSIAHFYTIVTRDTRDQDFSANRQLFLTERGYKYDIEDDFKESV
ncbi:MAG: DNA repair helicase XPB [archaeon]